jgi:cell division septation protein DedD
MSNNRSRAVHSKRRSDEALNVADFKIDDILNVPGDQLLAEVAEDFGDPAFLAAEFDSIARPALSSHNSSGVNRGGAIATIPMQPAAFGAAPVRAFPRHPRVSRAVLAILTEWPLRRRIFLGTFATVMIVAALAPGIVSQDDPLTRSPAPTLSRPLPTGNPAPVGEPADQSPVVQNRLHALRQPSWADQKHLRTATDGDQDGGLVPDRQMSPPPSAPVPARALAPQSAAATPATPPAAARAPVQAPAAATPRVAEGGGFFVQLSALKSQAEAQSTFLTLRLKYTMLKGHEPVIRRKDEGQRGTIYALQVGPFKSPDDADELCKQLRTAGGICFVTRN